LLWKFSNQEVSLQSGDMIYIFSDGYPDQFGGPEGEKFKNDNFRDLLFSIHKLSPSEELNQISARFKNGKVGV
jgi:serine phosphatase RsbU (regulator of sigma subunit)